METELFDVPILFIMWNRPEFLEYSFRVIRDMKPKDLYIACDGFRLGERNNDKLVVECRKTIEQQVDWPCNLNLRYLEKNAGCKNAVSGAITWFFENVESGIIIEDDVVCQMDFFHFARELLSRFKEDESVGAISANSFYTDRYLAKYNHEYYFSAFPHIWGWATWRRVWNEYSAERINLRSISLWKYMCTRFGVVGSLFWLKYWLDTNSGSIDTWDYQLANLFFKKRLVCCCPVKELSRNIGYSRNSTNTSEGTNPQKDVGYLTWPLKHPPMTTVDIDADREVQKRCFQPSIRNIIKKKVFLQED